ncbi:MAG: sigma-70 family RNA polymerase sigma factor [Bryobacteraceae bacterium]|nr:sigma-70 family RNA polymerase sigma factor [Bryobacteraceae bacterium]
MSENPEVTRLLANWREGNSAAAEELVPLVYRELRQLAGAYMRRERGASTLQPTALVHEAWVRLAGSEQPQWQSRSHFIGVAARCMRQILVDHARRNLAEKRGGDQVRATLNEAISFSNDTSAAMVALHEALDELTKISERKAKIVELRFFGGFSVEETAQALEISIATVGREQRLAEAWLYRELNGDAQQS